MKFSKYNIIEETDYGLIVYNSLNECYVKLKKEAGGVEHFNRLRNSDSLDIEDSLVKALYERKYIVDDDTDEYSIAHEKIENHIKNLKIFNALIYVTDQCNFRCVYCEEEHIDRRLSDENWDALYKHLEKNIINGNYKRIALSFFGGEPLLELNKIEECLSKLKLLQKKHPDFSMFNTITTNGYLLSPKVYDRLSELDVKHYQITVDGFAEQHNQTRPRVDGSPTWDKIIENLKYINSVKDDVTINYRINCGKVNNDKTPEFVEWSKQTFDNPKFQITVEAVGCIDSEMSKKYAMEDETKEFTDVNKNLNHSDKGYYKNLYKPHKLLGLVCHFVFPGHYVISSNGKLSKCADYFRMPDNYIGEFMENGDIKFYDNYKDWIGDFELEECKECPHYPLCAGMTCVYKKATMGDKRTDCDIVKNISSKKFAKGLRDGFLD